jgi:hypothetical protein
MAEMGAAMLLSLLTILPITPCGARLQVTLWIQPVD